MPLYVKRFSTMEIAAPGLQNRIREQIASQLENYMGPQPEADPAAFVRGAEVEDLAEVEEVTIQVGSKTITIKIRKGGTSLGGFGQGSRVDLTVSEKAGYSKSTTLFKVEL